MTVVAGADVPCLAPGVMADMERWWAEREALLGADSHAETWRQKENFLLDNPVVRDSQGRPQFRLQFDLRQFKPEEVTVRTIGQQLIVQARHEEAGPDKKVHREYCRQCTLPGDVTPEALVSRLSRSGILTIHAPLPAAEEDRVIPIDRC
ncbi:hypothetical protein C0Q70_17311 [Pomacea canaliculata]|uniref:SHSP domain-containing protein n=1 Tax=Pomacea canaliculata TaxID=400727 RepID=A0A2T7NK23_POMCA|nr:hypothetical protein C0Q70_17311 [Pomacea canaliculata]